MRKPMDPQLAREREPEPAKQKLLALIVLESPAMRRLLTHQFQRGGYQVIEAKSGREALARARETRPQIIVSEQALPDMEGIEFCRNLRERAGSHIPYFILLMDGDEEDRLIQAFLAGVDDYLPLPLQPAGVVARITAGRRVMNTPKLSTLNGIDASTA